MSTFIPNMANFSCFLQAKNALHFLVKIIS